MSLKNINISTAGGSEIVSRDYYRGDNHVPLSTPPGLAINASSVDGWKFTVGNNCTLLVGDKSEITCGHDCVIRAGFGSVIKAGANSVIIKFGGDWRPLLSKDPVHIILDNSSMGYTVVKNHNIVIDGEEREISERTYRSIKSLLPS